MLRQLTMLRILGLSILSAASVARAAEPGFAAVPLARTVAVLQGGECNIAVSSSDEGSVVVDTCSAETADSLMAAIKRLSNEPIRFVVDTHAHGDHTGGNAALQRHAPVIAHDNARSRMAAGNEVTGDKPAPDAALPKITFSDEMILRLNGEEIRLLHVPAAHTDGDVVVFFKKANVVCMGDLFISPAASFGDRWFGGGMLGLIEALEFLLPQIPADAKIVPGHGTVATRADAARGLQVLKEMKATVEAAVRSGKTLDQLTAERPFDPYRQSVPSWSSSDKSLDGWVRNFYREISTRQAN